jgi:hypothetical protein
LGAPGTVDGSLDQSAPPHGPREPLVGWRPSSADPRIASARIRCLNPLRELVRRGYPVELFDAARSGMYAAVVYSKLYDSTVQSEARRLRANGTRVVLDLCDNHFYNPEGLESLRRVATELRRMIDLADELVASTDAMARVLDAEAGGTKPITVIGDAVELGIDGVPAGAWERWRARRRLRRLRQWLDADAGRVRLVWFGAHGGPSGAHGMADLEILRSAAESVHRERPVSLTVISNSAATFGRLIRPWAAPTRYLDWNAGTFLEALRMHTIAVIPAGENPFTRCKTNNRLVTALAAGLAVVASGIPSYRPFEGCCVLDNWSGGLRRYVLEPEQRERDVAAGQALVRRDWTLGRIADHWQRYFDGLRARAAGVRPPAAG